MPEARAGLTGLVVVAVLFAALLHASWNAFIKAGPDKALDTALVHGLASVVALPVVALWGFAAPVAWPYLAGSLLTHIGYYVALAGAYRHGELGMTYPLMRGTAPLLVALGSLAFIGEALSATAWLGVAGICAGVLALGLAPGPRPADAPRQPDPQRRKAIGFALGNAVVIALYTVIDGLGVRASGDAVAYVATLFLFDGLPYSLLVLWQRRAGLAPVRAHVAARWRPASLGTLASVGSYGIALWAMTQAPVAAVAALRETSVLFAALIGVWLLREPFTGRRAAGTLVILAGVMTLRFG